jgi:hypothetical protein
VSLVKFTNRKVHRGKKLHWGRVQRDGLPYRGAFPPMYTEEEFEQAVVRVGDPQAETFKLDDRDQHQAFLQVLDGIVNGWFQCLFIERYRSPKKPTEWYAHVEWVEYFLEDGHPTPYLSNGTMELASGQQQFLLDGGGQG